MSKIFDKMAKLNSREDAITLPIISNTSLAWWYCLLISFAFFSIEIWYEIYRLSWLKKLNNCWGFFGFFFTAQKRADEWTKPNPSFQHHLIPWFMRTRNIQNITPSGHSEGNWALSLHSRHSGTQRTRALQAFGHLKHFI